MSEVRVNNLSNENNTGGPTISGITTYSGRHFFVPPQGDTASRPSDCEPGSLRFNTDSAHLEYFRGNAIGCTEIEAALTEPLGGGTGSNTGLGTRALFGGGLSPSGYVDTIDYITLSTLGNAQGFGEFAGTDRGFAGGASSRTRALFMGGYAAPSKNNIDFNIFASLGNSTDFGNLIAETGRPKGMAADQVSALFAGGDEQPGTRAVATIDFVIMATEGNALDFGDLVDAARSGTCSTMGSSTRGIFAGGNTHPATINTIEFVTVATTGNASDFGDLTAVTTQAAAFSNSTRGVTGGGQSPSNTNVINFITIATTGNAVDFGDRTHAVEQATGASSPTRGVFAGGNPLTNLIDFVEISTTGNAIDFGDLTEIRRGAAGASNGHGGL